MNKRKKKRQTNTLNRLLAGNILIVQGPARHSTRKNTENESILDIYGGSWWYKKVKRFLFVARYFFIMTIYLRFIDLDIGDDDGKNIRLRKRHQTIRFN